MLLKNRYASKSRNSLIKRLPIDRSDCEQSHRLPLISISLFPYIQNGIPSSFKLALFYLSFGNKQWRAVLTRSTTRLSSREAIPILQQIDTAEEFEEIGAVHNLFGVHAIVTWLRLFCGIFACSFLSITEVLFATIFLIFSQE